MMQASCKWVYRGVLIVTSGDTCPRNKRAWACFSFSSPCISCSARTILMTYAWCLAREKSAHGGAYANQGNTRTERSGCRARRGGRPAAFRAPAVGTGPPQALQNSRKTTRPFCLAPSPPRTGYQNQSTMTPHCHRG